MNMVIVPPTKQGWLRKMSRGVGYKNWKKRYIVLHLGKIFYYEDSLTVEPFGKNLKVLSY
jgi:hypothetical protein